ncbi:unnamed protein product [Jaminaea pallidilutea]
MEGGGRRVLSYSDAYAAPSGDVDLDAPLPSLAAPVPPTTPAPSTSRRKQRATLAAEHQQHRQHPRNHPFPQQQHHQHVAYPQHHLPPGYPLQQPQPWYSGPPPPVHYPAPQPLPFPPPFAYQHAGPSSMPYGPVRPAPGVPFQDSRAFPQPLAPLPQTLQPRQDLQTPTPPWSRDRSPQPRPQTARKPWPHSSLRAWNSVVIDDCDASSDEEDEQEAHSSDPEDGEASPVRRTKTRIMARMTRCQTTAEFVALWRKLNGMEEGDDKRPPSSSGVNGANAAEAGAVVSDSSISQAEYDKKQREINEMRDKIRRLEAAAQEKRRRQTEAAAAPTATPIPAPPVDGSQSEETSAPQTEFETAAEEAKKTRREGGKGEGSALGRRRIATVDLDYETRA